MFTGLIEACVPVVECRRVSGALDLILDVGDEIASDLGPGASLAVNGVCLTVSGSQGARRTFRAIAETLSRTGLGGLRVGDRVNVERAMRVGDRLGGHWVQGHVDGVGALRSRDESPGQTLVRVACEPALTRHMVRKGSICIDGISLTLVDVDNAGFSCALIPETLKRTNLGHLPIGARVNLETDILAKYVEKLTAGARGGLDRSKLWEEGYH